MQNNSWARLLAYVTGLVNQRLLLQCEYLIAENRILRSHVSGQLRLSNAERSTLAEIGKRLGRKCLAEVACVAKPEDWRERQQCDRNPSFCSPVPFGRREPPYRVQRGAVPGRSDAWSRRTCGRSDQ